MLNSKKLQLLENSRYNDNTWLFDDRFFISFKVFRIQFCIYCLFIDQFLIYLYIQGMVYFYIEQTFIIHIYIYIFFLSSTIDKFNL